MALHLSMSNGFRKRLRQPRVAALDLPPGRFAQTLVYLRRGDVLARLGVAAVGLVVMWILAGGWVPPLGYRQGYVPERNLTAKVAFKQPNERAREEARALAQSQEPVVYRQDAKELELLRAALQRAVAEVASAETFDMVDAETWKQFQAPMPEGTPPIDAVQSEEQFKQFRMALGGAAGLPAFEQAVAKAFATIDQYGLLDKLSEEHGQGNQKEIVVYPLGRPQEKYRVKLSDVLIADAETLNRNLKENLTPPVAVRVFAWLKPRLKSTLTLDLVATAAAREAAAAAVPEGSTDTAFEPGQTLAAAGKPLTEPVIEVLKLEHAAQVAQLTLGQKFARAGSLLGMLLVIFGLCGYYLFCREPLVVDELPRLVTLLGMALATLALADWTSADPARAELIPILLFGVTLAIAYRRDVAMVLSLSLIVVLVIAQGFGFGEFLILTGVTTSAIVQLGRIRSRSKLLKVGAISGVVAFLTTIGVGVLAGQPWGTTLFKPAAFNALWALAAGFLLTGLLPAIEKMFGVLTEISLLEWGDVSHPLLQELVRRAPGTYNHSINVASIAEAAAESIGARGILVRVGAYFHDIGKMLKPNYFAENQVAGANRHDTLVPAMSTLIIIAHIKDGADLARQHNLPQPIIDFIEQHHGTTLVEYFYSKASVQCEADPSLPDVQESSYRYPGPKPQTLEAAVLMLADAVESASRTLVEPSPTRIEGLVEEISMKKLLDGQFDECGLTLEQLRSIQDSLVKSLSAVYHGRVKYPAQQTA